MFSSRLVATGITKLIGCWLILSLSLFGLNSGAIAAPKAKEIPFWNDSEEESQLAPNHSFLQSFLDKYVQAEHPSGITRFDYTKVSVEDRDGLKQYLDTLQLYDPRQFSTLAQKAYWLNLYNAGLIDQILDSEPEESMKDISSRVLWRKKRFYISMQKLSLDNIQHGILRPIFSDPRVHFCLFAGTIGSANMMPKAFTTDNIEAMLDKGVRDYLNHARGVSFDDNRLILSRIFDWYQEDFGGNLDGVKAFISAYLTEDTVFRVAQSEGVRYEYDWTLNKP